MSMAIQSIRTNLKRLLLNPRNFILESTTRNFSTPVSITILHDNNQQQQQDDDEYEEESDKSEAGDDDLKSRIFRVRLPKRSATNVLENWVSQGNKVTIKELRDIAKDLRRANRYKHALEIFSWMKSQNHFCLSATDHSILLELIVEVQGFVAAEDYFTTLTDTSSRKAVCIPLLQAYVKERSIEKAETLMSRMQESGLTVNPHPFNAMMKLYVATKQFEKVPEMIRHMKCNQIPQNVLSYNLWMSACYELSGVSSAVKVYEEMQSDRRVKVGWSTYCTLANFYIRSGLGEKATESLKLAEQTLSTSKRLGYLFLITLYSHLGNKYEILRLWRITQSLPERITCRDYMSIMSCLVKMGDIEEAKKVFKSWDSQRRGKYDIRVSNILLGAYARSGYMDKAESLHLHTLEKGGLPNYKTWEILMEGWVKSKEMDKAVTAMKKGFSMLKHCQWRPSPDVVVEIAEYFEECNRFEDAKKYFKVVRGLGLATLPLYKSLVRVFINAQKPAPDFLKMMKIDEIEIDEEVNALIKCSTEVNRNLYINVSDK